MKLVFKRPIFYFGFALSFILLAQETSVATTLPAKAADSNERALNGIHNAKIASIIRKWIAKNSFDSDKTKITVNDFLSPEIQSVEIYTYEYYPGAATGTGIYKCFTYQTKTGIIYKLPDLFRPKVNWEKILWPYVKDKFKDNSVEELPSGDYKIFSLDHQNLNLYFGQSEFGFGPVIINVPLGEIRTVLRPAFIPIFLKKE